MKNKALAALLSLVIAFAMWAYVVTVVSPESESTFYDVPVVLDGKSLLESRDLMIVSNQDLKVDLTLSGYRMDLNKLNSHNITLLADLSQINEPGEHVLHYTISYPGTQTGVIHTVNRDPQNITITVVERSKKEIPVEVAYSGSLPEGYIADTLGVSLDHTSVTLHGPKDVLSQIEKAVITIDLTGKTTTTRETLRYRLCDENGEPIEDVSTVTVNVSDIRATLAIRKQKVVPLVLRPTYGPGLNSTMVTMSPEFAEITISGSEATLRDIEQIELPVDLSSLMESTVLTLPIVLPEGVTSESGETSVEVQISMPEMAEMTYEISNIKATKLPDSLQIKEIVSKELSITVRGTKERIAQLKAMLEEDPERLNVIFRADVDLSNAKMGTWEYLAKVEVFGIEGLGAVANKYVKVTVMERPQNLEG